jgi:hypothetical protein
LKYKTDFAAQAVDLLAVGGDQFAILGGLELEFFAGHQDLALVRVFQQVDAAQERGLAGTGGTQDRDHIAVAGGQRDALEHLQLAVAFVQVADFKRGRGLSHVRSSLCFAFLLLAAFLARRQASIAFHGSQQRTGGKQAVWGRVSHRHSRVSRHQQPNNRLNL